MLGLWHFRNSSGRVWALLLTGIVFGWIGDWYIGWAFQQDPSTRIEVPDVEAPGEQPDLGEQVHKAVVSAQIEKVDASGRSEFLLGPLAAAAAFGGVVLLVGGAGAVLMWRGAAEKDEA